MLFCLYSLQEALKYSQEDIKIMTSLARLYMQVNNIGECQVMCSMILKVDPNNENASVLMADLSFRRVSSHFFITYS